MFSTREKQNRPTFIVQRVSLWYATPPTPPPKKEVSGKLVGKSLRLLKSLSHL